MITLKQISSFKGRLLSERFHHPEKQTGSERLFPFLKLAEKNGGLPRFLKEKSTIFNTIAFRTAKTL